MSQNQHEPDLDATQEIKTHKPRPSLIDRVKTFYREQPVYFAIGLMGVSALAMFLGAYLQGM